MCCKSTTILTIIIVSFSLIFLSGCQTKAQTGAAVGGAAGAGLGAIIGHQSGHTGTGALIGGAIGAGGGYLAGRHMDKKEANQQAAATPQAPDTVVINVPNKDGTTTPITLKRSANGWVGPNGEIYSNLPTSEELRPTYGK